jgi:hypothetical protein
MARTAVLFLALPLVLQLRAQTFEARTPCPAPGRYWTAATGNSTHGYAGTGVESFDVITSQRADIWEYDPVTDAWTAIPDYPGGPMEGVDAFTIGERIFFGFGTPFIQWSSALYEYLPVTQQWVQRASIPEPTAYQRGFVIGDTYYMGPFWPNNTMYAYHADTDTWTTAAAYPGEHVLHACTFVMDGLGYMGSGLGFSTGSQEHWFRYDPVADTWTPIADLFPATDQSSATTVLNTGYVYNVGGDFSAVYRYDPAQDQWLSAGGPPTARTPNGSCFTVGSTGYHVFGTQLIGGVNVSVSDLWAFTPEGTGMADTQAADAPRVVYGADGVRLLSDGTWTGGGMLHISDVQGRMLRTLRVPTGAPLNVPLRTEDLGSGLRVLQISGGGRWTGRVVLP